MLPMTGPVHDSVDERAIRRADAVFHWTGLLVRAAVYAFVFAIADRYDCGRSLLTGMIAGDLAGQLVALAWDARDGLVQTAAELLLLGLVVLFVRGHLVWPEEPPLRAVLFLAALGGFVSRVGGSMLTRFGPSERGLA